MTTKGVLYFVAGPGYLTRLLVSIYSLRKQYKGPIAISTPSTGRVWDVLCGIANTLNATLIKTPFETGTGFQTSFHEKTRTHLWSPFDHTIFLDADTTIVGDITFLFPVNGEFVLTPEENQVVRDVFPKLSRAEQSQKHLVEYCHQNPHLPVINTGIFAYPKHHPLLDIWHRTAQSILSRVCDETAMQLLYPHYPYRIVSEAYNRNVKWTSQRNKPTVIWHHTRGRHLQKWGLPYFTPFFRECWDKNLAKIQEWAVFGDQPKLLYLTRVASVSQPPERKLPPPAPNAHRILRQPCDATVITTEDKCNLGQMDRYLASYPAELLGNSVQLRSQTILLGGPNVPNAITPKGQTLNVPIQKYHTVLIVAVGVDKHHKKCFFHFNYEDYYVQTHNQPISDWYNPGPQPNEEQLRVLPYVYSRGRRHNGKFALFGYALALDDTRNLKNITLPNNTGLKILAIKLFP